MWSFVDGSNWGGIWLGPASDGCRVVVVRCFPWMWSIGVPIGKSLPVSWYIVSILFPIRKIYWPRHFFTDSLLLMRLVMACMSTTPSVVPKVRMILLWANVRICIVPRCVKI